MRQRESEATGYETIEAIRQRENVTMRKWDSDNYQLSIGNSDCKQRHNWAILYPRDFNSFQNLAWLCCEGRQKSNISPVAIAPNRNQPNWINTQSGTEAGSLPATAPLAFCTLSGRSCQPRKETPTPAGGRTRAKNRSRASLAARIQGRELCYYFASSCFLLRLPKASGIQLRCKCTYSRISQPPPALALSTFDPCLEVFSSAKQNKVCVAHIYMHLFLEGSKYVDAKP